MDNRVVSNQETLIDTDMVESRSDARLSSIRNVLNILPNVEIRPMNGRVLGTKSPHIPPMIKQIIGEAAHIGEDCSSVAETFDVHRNTVTACKKETGLAKADLDKQIRETAINRIVDMFETSVSPEMLAKMEAKDATRAMKDLSKIAESFSDKQKLRFNGPTIVIYAPNQHSEDEYDVIDIEAVRK